jgi:His/Glu/Gln/Arg/opine family amino acid ABC transporter permease subunit
VSLDWQFITDAGVIAALGAGLQLTVILCLCGAIGSLLVGLTISAMRIAGPKPLQRASHLYVLVVRNIPLLIALFFLYFGTAILFPANNYPILRTPHLGEIIATVTISLVVGGFVSEVIRAGVEALPVGQMEAALASGLSSRSAYRHVVIPQLLPIILPGLSNEIVNVLKGTTMAMTIGVAELMYQAQRIESETFRGVETMTAVTVMYFVLACGIIAVFHALERVFQIPQSR